MTIFFVIPTSKASYLFFLLSVLTLFSSRKWGYNWSAHERGGGGGGGGVADAVAAIVRPVPVLSLDLDNRRRNSVSIKHSIVATIINSKKRAVVSPGKLICMM